MIILVVNISTIIPSYAVQDLQKIECVDDNLNINGIDLNQLTRQQQDQIKRLAGIDYEDADTQNSNYNHNYDNDYRLSDDGFSVDNNLVNVCVNANFNDQKVRPPPPPPPPPVISLNKEWFVCDEQEDIDCTVRSESNIAFEPPSSGNYIACTEQDNNCPFVADTGLNIEVSGNSPTPNTIPALVGTQATVNIGSGDFDVTESLSTESQSLFDQLLISVQNGPAGIAYDPVNERMFVANLFSDSVSVISTATNTVIGSPIPVEDAPIDIAYDNATERMYVANLASNTVSVISTATNTVVGTSIPVGSRPAAIAYDPVNERMYVANYNFGGSGTVSVISTATNTVIGSPIPVGNGPRDIAYDNATERMYVANSVSNTVSVISTATNTVIGSPIPVSMGPTAIAYDSENERMYVASRVGTLSDPVSVISTATNTVIGSPIPVGFSLAGITYDPVNERMFVAAQASDTVSVISTATNTVIGSPIPVGNGPVELAYDPVNERMYVTNFEGSFEGSNVSVLYLSAKKVCQASGFDDGELRTYQSNGQMIQPITCVNFVGECSDNIQEGETKECTVQDYAVRVNEITDTSTITTTPNEQIHKQQDKQETEDEEEKDTTTDKELSAKSPLNPEISK